MSTTLLSDARSLRGKQIPSSEQERTRILFVSASVLGWRTYGERLARYAAEREDFESAHIQLPQPLWLRLLTHPWSAPGPIGRALRKDAGVPRLVSLDTAWAPWVDWSISRHLPTDRFDLVHFSPAHLALTFVRRPRIPFSVSIDATTRAFAEQRGATPSTAAVGRERVLLEQAALVVCLSRWARDAALSDTGVRAERTLVAYPAPDRAPDRPGDQSEGAGHAPRLLFVGNDWERKGGPRLLSWHQKHWADRAELWVASARAPQDSNARNVRWLGDVPNERLMREVFPSADVFVLPTSFDQSPNVLAEAIAAGLPIVVSRMAATPEYVEHGETGFLVEPKDDEGFVAAIDKLVSDSVLRRELSRATRARASTQANGHTTFDRIFDHLLAVLQASSGNRSAA